MSLAVKFTTPVGKPLETSLCLQDHLSTSIWSECVVYLGIGVFVKDPLSIDQQLPSFLHPFAQSQDPNGPRAKAILFDPEFRNKPPLCVEGGEWHEVNYNLFVKGNLLLVISNNWCDGQARFYDVLERYIQAVLTNSGAVIIGVFTQPYCKVEENQDIVNLYNRLLDDEDLRNKDLTSNLKYYHLADYATRTEHKETLVWYLNSRKHDQDVAVLKEVSRYKGEGLNFGVCVYAQYPGTKYKCNKDNESEIDYWFIQNQVEEDERKRGTEDILVEDEFWVSAVPISFSFST